MAVVQHCKDEVRLQQCANTIALMARKLSKDPKVISSLIDLFLFFNKLYDIFSSCRHLQ